MSHTSYFLFSSPLFLPLFHSMAWLFEDELSWMEASPLTPVRERTKSSLPSPPGTNGTGMLWGTVDPPLRACQVRKSIALRALLPPSLAAYLPTTWRQNWRGCCSSEMMCAKALIYFMLNPGAYPLLNWQISTDVTYTKEQWTKGIWVPLLRSGK